MKRCYLPAIVLLCISAVRAEQAAKIVEVRKIWDQAPHNAFTDLVRFQDRWFCVFREGAGHVSPDGALRVLTSADGQQWESAALVTSPNADLRDAKITVTPDGQLMLSGAGALHDTIAAYAPVAGLVFAGRPHVERGTSGGRSRFLVVACHLASWQGIRNRLRLWQGQSLGAAVREQ